MKYTIKVTQRDIDLNSHYCSSCPVAKAIKRATGRVCYVGGWEFNFEDNLSHHYYFPYDVKNKIFRYDSGFGMYPFEFELMID